MSTNKLAVGLGAHCLESNCMLGQTGPLAPSDGPYMAHFPLLSIPFIGVYKDFQWKKIYNS